jgi:hypothetical protein
MRPMDSAASSTSDVKTREKAASLAARVGRVLLDMAASNTMIRSPAWLEHQPSHVASRRIAGAPPKILPCRTTNAQVALQKTGVQRSTPALLAQSDNYFVVGIADSFSG